MNLVQAARHAVAFSVPGGASALALSGRRIFKIAAGIEMQHVPCKGSAPALKNMFAAYNASEMLKREEIVRKSGAKEN